MEKLFKAELQETHDYGDDCSTYKLNVFIAAKSFEGAIKKIQKKYKNDEYDDVTYDIRSIKLTNDDFLV